MKTKHCLIWTIGCWLAMALAVWAGSQWAASNLTTVDTRGSLITVSGRVLDALTHSPLAGSTVTLAGQTATSSGAGMFNFPSISLSGGNTLLVSKSGYATYSGTVPVPAGATTVTVADVLMQPAEVDGMPVVTRVEPRLKGLFISGVTLKNDFTASVNWNGITPKLVRFSVNGVQVADQTGNGPEYVTALNMGDSPFRPCFDPAGNQITVQAVGSGGQESKPFNLFVGVLPMPEAVRRLTAVWPFTTYLDGHLGLDYDLPDPPIKTVVTFPVIGRFGFEVAANGSFDYTVTDGDWEASLGIGAEGKQGKRGKRPSIPGLIRAPKMKLYIGNKEISGKIEAGARGTATFQSGITFDEVFGRGEIEAKLELGRVSLLDIVPGLGTAAGWVPGLNEMTKSVSIIIYVIPEVDGEITFATQPEIKFDTLELTGKVGLEAAYEPKLTDGCELRVYVGGEPSVTFGVPGDLFKKVRFKAYAGAEYQAWFFKFGPVEYVFVDVSYPVARMQNLAMRASDGTTGIALMRVGVTDNDAVHPISRDYLQSGPERFLASDRVVKMDTGASSAKSISVLRDFRAIGQNISNVMMDNGRSMRSANSQALPINQADLPLLENAFPFSQPSLAGRGSELMLLYVTDNGSSNALQFTDIRWTRWDGANWSTPLNIETNTRAEFSPQVAYDGNGDAIALWERVSDPGFNQTNLTAMAAQMEIVWSKWSRANGTWSTPSALTANTVLDHAPVVCGPMADGSVLAAWTRNSANLLMGTNGAESQVLWSKWNPTSQSWSGEQTLIPSLAYRMSQSLAGVSNRAVYGWTRDMDGALTNTADQQVFYCEWSGSAWGAVRQLTTNSLGNHNARVAVSSAQDVYLVWQQDTNLVMNRNFSTNITLVRRDSQTAGFSDFEMTVGPAGNLVLLWQEMSADGSDAHYSVYDPISDTWSRDAQLFHDSALERSFAPVWDAVGNLTFAYNKVEMLHVDKTVTLENGGTVIITNVPQPGRVDLCVTKRALVRDLELKAGNFTVGGVNYLPGDPLSLSAKVVNIGNVAMSNVVVAFYDGNPTNGGVLITNVTLSGWLAGAATNTASAVWIVPEPATNHVLFAVVNPVSLASEFTATNNTQSVCVGGTDLTVSLISQQAETNGAVRVIAQVQNIGAPTATNSVLAMRRVDSTGTNIVDPPLATVNVSSLEPGRLAQVALDLPVGTQSEGEAYYQLRADDSGVVADVDRNNNTSVFAVNLWVDSDSDGMPNAWELHYGLNPNDPSDAKLDKDGDGMSNLAECRVGSDPIDPLSYLRIRNINGDTTNGLQITWGSIPNKMYSVERSAMVNQGYTNIAEHLLSTPPENVFLDMTVTNGAKYFYRIKVE